MKQRYSKGPQRELARERIRILFQQAEEEFPTDKDLAHRYVTLARKIAMKIKVKIPAEFRRRFCKHCYCYLQPGVNSRVRTRAGKVVISCLECKKFMRVPLR